MYLCFEYKINLQSINLFLLIVECYEKEVEQTKKLTSDIVENKDYVNKLTTSLNDIENKFSKLLNDHEQYKTTKENTISVLKNKLNASEEIVQQILPGN